jgi:hypothetical protein
VTNVQITRACLLQSPLAEKDLGQRLAAGLAKMHAVCVQGSDFCFYSVEGCGLGVEG